MARYPRSPPWMNEARMKKQNNTSDCRTKGSVCVCVCVCGLSLSIWEREKWRVLALKHTVMREKERDEAKEANKVRSFASYKGVPTKAGPVCRGERKRWSVVISGIDIGRWIIRTGKSGLYIIDWCDSRHVPPSFSGHCQSTEYWVKNIATKNNSIPLINSSIMHK